MNFIADAARTSHALALAELCAIARDCGMRTELPTPISVHPSAARLLLGRQFIALHLVVNTGSARRQLSFLQREIWYSPCLEHYVVLSGFSAAELEVCKASFGALPGRKVTVGCPLDYACWVRNRLGPLAHLATSSPVRRLMEDLLCVTRAVGPAEKDPFTCSYRQSKITPDLEYGQRGVQGAGTLFTHIKGRGAVRNLEGDMLSQKAGTDLNVASSYTGDDDLLVEVKTESYPSGRITLELHSCYKEKKGKPPLARTAGWLDTSQAHLLQSTIWPTGDSLVIDFYQLRQWLSANPRKLKPRLGGEYANQDYYSWILLGSMKDILTDIPGAVHLRLGDWLPGLYPGEFEKASLVSNSLGRTLEPLRLT